MLWERRKYLAEEKNSKEDIEYTFTPYITKKDGTRIYASQYGLKAFKIPRENN